jgi:2,5-diketo-D-gluconate reductase A
MTNVPNVTLNTGYSMPQVGFGVYKIPDDEVVDAVHTAFEAGYRSIDTATLYRNEEGVGAAVASSGLSREELFITTKLWNDDQGYDETLRAFDTSMDRLKLDYLDLYLIHWPVPAKDRFVPTWRAFEKLHAEGRIRSIGVSNFQPHHLQRLFAETDIVPAVNQIELHPQLQQEQLRAFDAEHGIATEAWSPIGRGTDLLEDSTITALAAKYDRSPAQVVLRWHLQLGNVVIPKSVTASRIRENIALFDFELTDEDLKQLEKLDAGTRLGPDPDVLGS